MEEKIGKGKKGSFICVRKRKNKKTGRMKDQMKKMLKKKGGGRSKRNFKRKRLNRRN